MRILITGGSGFVGSQLADYLSARGHKVTIYDLKKSKWLNSKQTFRHGAVIIGPGGKMICSGYNKGNRTKILDKVFTKNHQI